MHQHHTQADAPAMVIVPGHAPSRSVEALRALWLAKRAWREMPRREDFRVDDFVPWLGRLNLLTIGAAGARFDVFGTSNSHDLGVEMTGLPLDALPSHARALAYAGIERVTQARAPVFETVRVVLMRKLMVYDRLILPLAGDDGHVAKVLVLIDNPRDESLARGGWGARQPNLRVVDRHATAGPG
jgi:hypothetical protein